MSAVLARSSEKRGIARGKSHDKRLPAAPKASFVAGGGDPSLSYRE